VVQPNISYDNQVISSYVTNITKQFNITLNTFSTLKEYTDTVSALVNSNLANQKMQVILIHSDSVTI
jgi:hypothetical protein